MSNELQPVSISEGMTLFRAKLSEIGSKAADAADEILENSDMSELYDYGQDLLNQAVDKLNNVIPEDDEEDKPRTFLDKILRRKNEKIDIRDTQQLRTVKEQVNSIFEALGEAADQLEKRNMPFYHLEEGLRKDLADVEKVLEDLELMVKDIDENSFERVMFENMKSPIEIVRNALRDNQKTVRTQLQVSEAFLLKIREIRLPLKNVVSTQLASAVQSAHTQKLIDTFETFKDTINKLMMSNAEEKSRVMLHSTQLATSQVVNKETVDHLANVEKDTAGKFVNIVEDSIKETIQINKSLNNAALISKGASEKLMIAAARNPVKKKSEGFYTEQPKPDTLNTIIADEEHEATDI